MALVANRVETRRNTDWPLPPELGSAPSCVSVTSEWFDDSALREPFLLKQTVSIIDQDGREVWREISEWTYEGLTAVQTPTKYTKETWAWCWLPKVNHRASLVKVALETSKWWIAGPWISGPLNMITVREGYVIYDILPSVYTPAQVNPTAAARGKALLTVASDHLPETGRPFTASLKSSAIVETPSAAQRARWETIEIEQTVIETDFLRTVTTRYRYDCLKGLVQVDGPHEERKNRHLEVPVELVAPVITGGAMGAQARIEIEGGDVELMQIWPVSGTTLLRPKTYCLYRRVVSRPDRTYGGDRYGLYETGAPAQQEPVSKIEDTAVTDYAGTPASPLPPQVGYTESENADPPAVEAWSLISEAKNPFELEQERRIKSRVVVIDTDMETDAVYEYKATARVGDSDSPESNRLRVTGLGGSYTSGLDIIVRKNGDDTEIDVRPPVMPGADPFGLEDQFGEAVVFEMPAAFDLANPSADGLPIETTAGDDWAPGLLETPEDLGRAVGLRQALRDQDRDSLRITPDAPLLMLERGMLVTIDPLAWVMWGRNLKISSQTVDTLWRVEGFGWTASRSDDGKWSVEIDPIYLEEA